MKARRLVARISRWVSTVRVRVGFFLQMRDANVNLECAREGNANLEHLWVCIRSLMRIRFVAVETGRGKRLLLKIEMVTHSRPDNSWMAAMWIGPPGGTSATGVAAGANDVTRDIGNQGTRIRKMASGPTAVRAVGKVIPNAGQSPQKAVYAVGQMTPCLTATRQVVRRGGIWDTWPPVGARAIDSTSPN